MDILDVFKGYHLQVHRIDRTYRVSMHGLHMIATAMPMEEALANLHRGNIFLPEDTLSPEELDHRLASAREEAAFAQGEVASGFPILTAQAIVALWGSLEAFVEDLVFTYLKSEPQILTRPEFLGIRVKLAEFQAADDDERIRLLIMEYSRQKNADLKSGPAGLELLLEPIQLAGEIEQDVRRNLLELSEVRNVIVHRAGMADARLAKMCPWVTAECGKPVPLGLPIYERYSLAVFAYSRELLTRAVIRTGRTRAEAVAIMSRRSGAPESDPNNPS